MIDHFTISPRVGFPDWVKAAFIEQGPHGGWVWQVNMDGRIVEDGPFATQAEALLEMWIWINNRGK